MLSWVSCLFAFKLFSRIKTLASLIQPPLFHCICGHCSLQHFLQQFWDVVKWHCLFQWQKWPCSSLLASKVEAPQFEHISPYIHPCWQFDVQIPTPFTTGMMGGDADAVPSMSLPPFPIFLMCPTRPTFFPFTIFNPLYFCCGIVTQWLYIVFLIFWWPPADTDNDSIF